jgi:uncharacterized repeat protein (TIGR04052 family)
MRTSPPRGLLALLALGLSPALGACSSTDTTSVLALESSPALGRVSLAITQGGVSVASVAFRVIDASGGEVASDEIDVAAPNAAISASFAAPAGEGYRVTLSATTADGARCTGSSAFDVFAGETREADVELVCDGAAQVGGVRVVGTIAPASCPEVELVAPTLQASVGASIELGASTTGSEAVSYAWSASSGTIDSPSSAQATFTCTAPGSVTLTLTATAGGCARSRDVSLTCVDGGAPVDACTDLGSSCHVVDPGSGPLHECHELGHAGDQLACAEERGACVTACGDALCQTLASLCHEVDPGSGALHECHTLGHSGDTAACFARGRGCFDLCTAAHAARDTIPVTLRFAAKVGSEDFACGTRYEGVGATGATVEPQDFRFYVQDVRLIDSAGVEVPVTLDERAPWQSAGVALLDFEDAQGACFNGDAATNFTVTGSVPPGDYDGVVFANGVPEALNHADPVTLPAPLQVGSMSWGWLLGFRFVRAELVQVAEAGAIPGLGLLHLGSTACTGSPQAGSVTCARSNRNEVRLTRFDPAASTIVADIGALFADTDLGQDAQCHSSGDACPALFDNIGLSLASGAPQEAQSVFRVE